MSYVCCRDTLFEGAIYGMESAEVRFFHHGNVSVQRLPRIGTYHIVNMGVICVVAVRIDNFQYLSKSRVVFFY